MRIGTKASAEVSSEPLLACRSRPSPCQPEPPTSSGDGTALSHGHTKDDLAAVEDTDHLVPWRFVVVDLEQLCPISTTRLSFR